MKVAFKLPQQLENAKKIKAVFSQRHVKVVKDCKYDAETGICLTHITQNDTLRFTEGDIIEMQIKVLFESGHVLVSEVMQVECTKGLSSEVIS